MPNTREKLIELLKSGGVRDFPFNAALADHLVANGVTLAKDINVLCNADRIRAMSDEELAHWICKKMMSCSSNVCPGADLCQSEDGVANGLVKWLKQPVEDK